MKKNSQLKRLRQSTALKEAKTQEFNDQGDLLITLGLKTADEFYSPCSYKTYELMSQHVSDYLETNREAIIDYEKLAIAIYIEEPTTIEEKVRIRDTVSRHQAEQIVVLEKERKRSLFKGISFTLIGIAIIALCLFLESTIGGVIAYAISIVAWWFEWVACDFLFFDIPRNRKDLIFSYKIFNAKVYVRQYDKKIKRQYRISDKKLPKNVITNDVNENPQALSAS